MQIGTCGSCKFFKYVESSQSTQPRKGDGWCHRHAPEPLAGGSGTGWSDWEWPAISSDDFCGEWELLPAK